MRPLYVPALIFSVGLLAWSIPQAVIARSPAPRKAAPALQFTSSHEVNRDVRLRVTVTVSPLLAGDSERQVVVHMTPLTQSRIWLDGAHFMRTVTAASHDDLVFQLHITPPSYALWELRPKLGLTQGAEPNDPDILATVRLSIVQNIAATDAGDLPRTWKTIAFENDLVLLVREL